MENLVQSGEMIEKQNLHNLWVNSKHSVTCVTEIKIKEDVWEKKIYEDIVTENLSKIDENSKLTKLKIPTKSNQHEYK